ncbi:MAG: moaC [Myxococcaceae bacterium]|nr:moaC [Myxococcaceae bacterium]
MRYTRRVVRRVSKPKLTHLDERGNARMVDVGQKATTARVAVAGARVRMQPATLRALLDGKTPKGDVLAVARVAGIQAAKRTWELIPMCHQVQLTSVRVELLPEGDDAIAIEVSASAADRTGVEMEALTAASIAALTLYDMLKAIDRGMVIESVALLEKSGGKSGDYRRKTPA